MLALADCNNDGCVVARSAESKALGIEMGTPFFKVRDLVDKGVLEVRSSNYTLYGDLSRRVMNILRESVPGIQVYSIDEAFLDLEGLPEGQWKLLCDSLVKKVKMWTGIPISIGIAPTKTLCKVANHFAKKYIGYHGVCMADTPEKWEKALKLTPIDDVWGIGWRGAPKMVSAGIRTAWDFVQRPASWVQKRMGVQGLRTWKELQGTPCREEDAPARRKSICTSRSFAGVITDKEELSLRVSDFAAICAAKLRAEGSAAGEVALFMQTNRFRADLPQYCPFAARRLAVAASSTQAIVGAALELLDTLYRDGYGYKKAGVVVDAIVEEGSIQGSLFDDRADTRDRENTVSRLMDRVNTDTGKNLLRVATQRPGHYSDGIRREHFSRLYSTSWKEMLEVR